MAILCTTAVSYAQNARMPAVPVDSAVRIGRLDNGLTYYIRHNEYPKGLADFFIAQKVGSVLEEDISVVWLTFWSICALTGLRIFLTVHC